MTPELTVVVLAVALGLVHIVVQVCATVLTRGMGFAMGARDEQQTPSPLVGRIERASRNFQETFPLFAAVVVAAVVAQKNVVDDGHRRLGLPGRARALPADLRRGHPRRAHGGLAGVDRRDRGDRRRSGGMT